MDEKDLFKIWLQDNLQHETKDIHFSNESREKVLQAIQKEEGSRNNVIRIERAKNLDKEQSSAEKISWWSNKVSLPMSVVSFSLAALFLLTAWFTMNIFYVSPQHIAKFEARQKIIVHQDNAPFGAVQVQVAASLQKGKGVDRP